MFATLDMRRLLAAVTVMVAVLLLAPSSAKAHAGHSHAAPVEAAHPAAIFSLDVLAQHVAATRDVAAVAVYVEAIDTSAGRRARSCFAGCCNHPGSGCCAAYLTADHVMAEPPLTRKRPPLADIGGAGIAPEALPEPPRYLN